VTLTFDLMSDDPKTVGNEEL